MKYPKFTVDHQSLMVKYLTPTVFDELKGITTPNGFSLSDAINSGVVNPNSDIGVYAGDEESYDCFSSIFNPIIHEYHGFSSNQQHLSNFDYCKSEILNPDIENDYILSTRIRVGRNLAGMPLGAGLSTNQRNEVESQVVAALAELTGELSGHYYPLIGMKTSVQKRLIEDHFLFQMGDKYLEAAGLNRDWPAGRGIFHNSQKNFLVWVNEEDQLRIIAMEKGGDIQGVFSRLLLALNELQRHLSFMFSDRLGYISSCPTNLGTAMRASVHIDLPCLAQDRNLFNKITEQYHLQIRGMHGEHSKEEGTIFDVSNRRRLGITEAQCVKDLYGGVVALIKSEKALETR